MDWNSLVDTLSDKIRSQTNQRFIETVLKKHPVELYLPEDAFFEGSIHVEGLIRLEGKVNGKIQCPIAIIAEKALVTAEIEANCLYIEGHFRGIARVSFLYLSQLGQCEGNIKTNCIFVEEGARMQSKVTIEKKDNPPQSESDTPSENQ
jgi:cytoskeletal protein CcmA (bactofilin family)